MRSEATGPVTTGPKNKRLPMCNDVRKDHRYSLHTRKPLIFRPLRCTDRFDIAGRENPAPTATPDPALLAPFRIVYRPPAAHTPPPSSRQGRGPPVRCRRAPYDRIEPQIQIFDDSPPSSHRSRPNEAVSANIFRDEQYQLDVHT
ncbi:hypothetical protein THAOC_19819 [Thalassiosira oceanica]|uniref:Uncharacterized protein n=1 Tax=Thalassiosira oceanica TaxID=159749 RepID=K0S3R7_THAOC|nr:hypothetical protein THAOC_19819 [Thalassiosira oceanica]|eukprot:EJK59905.1 hypothetical protein THAOC_19819 [Thalassiosira oceanica]